jgi:SPX domain protein involved in polyphosphate accumulation
MWSSFFKPTYPILVEEMKKAHKKLHEDPAASVFVDKFSSETSRFMTCVENQHRSHAMHAKALLRMASAASTKEQLTDVSRRVDDLAQHCLQLDAFVGEDAKLFQQVADQADARLATCCVNDLHQALGPFKNHPNSTPIIVFSDIYHAIRTGQAKLLLQQSQTASQGTEIEAWVAPTSFVRSTSKYWIEDDKLMTVLFKSVAEAPLLVYGKNGMLTSQPDLLDSLMTTQEDELWDRLATSISSVYFDSPDLFLYSERLARGEGAQLLRVRWYGPQPRGTQPVFLGTCTHAWHTCLATTFSFRVLPGPK